MPINTKELLDALSTLLDQENIRVTLRETGKGTLITAVTTIIGGLVAGPIGLAFGGTAGGIGAYMMTKDTFKPLGEVIRNDMTAEQREMLAAKVMFAVQDFHPADVAAILAILATNRSIHETVLHTVIGYLTKEMRLQVLD